MRRALLGAALLLTAGMSTTGTAFAGTYQVTACADAPSLLNNSWQPFNNNTTYLETSSNCGSSDVTGVSPATSGLAAADVLELPTNVPAGATAGWRFIAPPGDAISAISMDRDLFDNGPAWLPQIIDGAGNALPGETCPYNGDNGGCEASGVVTSTGLDTSSLAIELLCDPEPPLTVCGNGILRARRTGRAQRRDRHDHRRTAASDHLRKRLAVRRRPGARRCLSGTIDGADSSGVQYARVYVDGAPVAQQAYACDFTMPAPCPATSSNQFSLNTTTLSNGPHEIQAAVVNAAGNQTLSTPVQLTVDNTNPSAPTGLLTNGKDAGAWIDQPGTITWTNPSQPQDDPLSQVNGSRALAPRRASPPAAVTPTAPGQPAELAHLQPGPRCRVRGPARRASTRSSCGLQDAIGNTAEADSAAISLATRPARRRHQRRSPPAAEGPTRHARRPPDPRR